MISYSSFKRKLNPLLILPTFSYTACVTTVMTKPNEPFGGNPYPAELNELAQKNPLLAEELGKFRERLNK